MEKTPNYLYESLPYFVFSGKFVTTPSSINNYLDNYKRAAELTYEKFKEWLSGKEADQGSNWMPYGDATWKFLDCKIQQITYQNGKKLSYQDKEINQEDPFLGVEINSVSDKINGRIVDLDPEKTSGELWGFAIKASDNNCTYFEGKFLPTRFYDSWKRDVSWVVSNEGDGRTYEPSSAIYKSVLESVQFGQNLNSDFFMEFTKISNNIHTNRLSVKFTVDGYDYKNATGRVVGVITPYWPEQPISLAASRQLYPISKKFEVGPAYFQINKLPTFEEGEVYQVTLDLSNSIPTRKDNSNLLTDERLGDLNVGVFLEKDLPLVFSTIHLDKYKLESWYLKQGGIELININETHLKNLKNNSLCIWTLDKDKKLKIILKESEDGLFIKAETTAYRLNPNEVQEIKFAVRRFGQPVHDMIIKTDENDIKPVSTIDDNKKLIKQWAPTDKPKIHAKHVLVDNGYAIIKVTAPSGIGNPRKEYNLDSLVFQFNFKSIWESKYPVDLLIFDSQESVLTPTWKMHIEPILKQYACLYPLMGDLFGLASYSKVTQNLKAMERSLSAPFDSAHYMPVKRDLSLARRDLLIRWLRQPLYSSPISSSFNRIETLSDLKKAIQAAIELEHATIPVYMTALYSIKRGTNEEIASTIRGILMQEMLHVALACNLLNAIGGNPKLANPNSVPKFPGKLPYDIHPELLVSLGPCTKDRIEKVFMLIEQPSEKFAGVPNIELSIDTLKVTWHKERIGNTIGQFYGLIQEALVRLNETNPNLFVKNKGRQVSTPNMPGLIEVIDLPTSIAAIEIIIQQGEGISLTNILQNADSQISHYHKFLEIFVGKRLVKVEEQSENSITFRFDENNLIELKDEEVIDPWKDKKNEYTGEENELLDDFDKQYAKLLISLEKTFNGEPKCLEDAIALMRQIQINCMNLLNPEMRGYVKNGWPLAPKFDIARFLPVLKNKSALLSSKKNSDLLLREFNNVSFFKRAEKMETETIKDDEVEKSRYVSYSENNV